MLEELRVRSFSIIDEAAIEFSPGLNVLSVETGAGKTLVVGALQLLLGGRLTAETLRGSDETVIEGRFSPEETAFSGFLNEKDVSDFAGQGEGTEDTDDRDSSFYNLIFKDQSGELIIRRLVTDGKKSRFYLNGHMATAKDISQIASVVSEIFGQHEQMHLTKPAARRAALDQYCGISLDKLNEVNRLVRELDTLLAKLGGTKEELVSETEFLEFQLAEINAANITSESEDEQLATQEETLSSVAELKELSAKAFALLDRQERDSYFGARDQLGAAVKLLETKEYFGEVAGRLAGCLAELDDSLTELRHVADLLEDNPDALEFVRLRRNTLHKLCHKYGGDLRSVLAKREEIESRLAEISAQDELRQDLLRKREKLLAEKKILEREIGDIRRQRAPELSGEIEKYLAELNLAKARFVVELSDDDFAGEVDFLLAANPGEPPATLAKAASGGELSRVMLALKVVLSDGAGTYVFDEIDAGIGGQTALMVGKLLAMLAKKRQVIVVTHLAQVAAFADRHFVVDKISDDMETKTIVREVKDNFLLAELARMLSGSPTSEIALEHARELKSQAGLLIDGGQR